MIRRWPALKELHNDLHAVSGIANYTGMPGNPNPARSTEDIAVRDLPGTARREYEAVRRTIAATERYKNGRDRLKIIKLVYWDKTHTLEGAALSVPCSIQTAWKWNQEFIRMVASHFGLMD